MAPAFPDTLTPTEPPDAMLGLEYQTREVTLVRPVAGGIGLQIQAALPETGVRTRISHVRAGSQAAEAGLLEDDLLLAINGESVREMGPTAVGLKIKHGGAKVQLLLGTRFSVEESSPRSSPLRKPRRSSGDSGTGVSPTNRAFKAGLHSAWSALNNQMSSYRLKR